MAETVKMHATQGSKHVCLGTTYWNCKVRRRLAVSASYSPCDPYCDVLHLMVVVMLYVYVMARGIYQLAYDQVFRFTLS